MRLDFNIIVTISTYLILKFTKVNSFSSPQPVGASGDLRNNGISRIGILTSGGDCPSLNACIRSIVKTAKANDVEVWGLPIGFPGLMKSPQEAFKLDETYESTTMLMKGGSRLGGFVAADYVPFFDKVSLKEKASRISSSLDTLGIDGIIATGGDSSFDRIAQLLQHTGDDVNIPFVGIPKSIDNDIPETIYSLGFQSAVSVAADSIRNVRDTAESHRRVIVVECMGRDAGFLTLHAGLAGGADTILLPEFPIDKDALLAHVGNVYAQNKCSVIAVSESISLPQTGKTATYTTADGRSRLGGSGEVIARFISESLNLDARHVVLGHVQRGGSPNAFDQIMATTLGAHAVNAICCGESEIFVTINGASVENVPLEKVRKVAPKALSAEYPQLKAAQYMGIYCGSVQVEE